MKAIGLLILGFVGLTSVDSDCIDSLRALYFDAEDESAREAFYKASRHVDPSDPVCLGYRALATACYADTFFNPFKKWSYFEEGRDELEALIKENHDNVELHFMRYSLQANVPCITDYDHNLQEDFDLILLELKKPAIDIDFWSQAVEVMLKSKNTPEGHVITLEEWRAKTLKW